MYVTANHLLQLYILSDATKNLQVFSAYYYHIEYEVASLSIMHSLELITILKMSNCFVFQGFEMAFLVMVQNIVNQENGYL